MIEAKLAGLVVAVTSIGAVAVACDSRTIPSNPCRENNISYYIPGSKADVLSAERRIRVANSQDFDLSIVKGAGDFFDRLGNLISQPALYRPGTAALVHASTEIFGSDSVSLVVLSDGEFQKQDPGKRFQGVLLWSSGDSEEKLEIKIGDITSTEAGSSLANLDGATTGKEVITTNFDISTTNHSIEELGGGKFELYLQEVDCATGSADNSSYRLFNLSKSN